MNKRSTIFRYIRFQIIELGILVLVIYLIRFFIALPDWLVVTLIAAAVLKDTILYFFTWQSYIVPDTNDASLMIGKICTATHTFENAGKVLYKGEIWKVQLNNPGKIEKGDRLKITQLKGLLLIVEAADPEHR